MKFTITAQSITRPQADTIVVFAKSGKRLSGHLQLLDDVSEGHIKQLYKQEDLQNSHERSLCLYHIPNYKAKRVIIITADPNKLSRKALKKLATRGANAICQSQAQHVACYADDIIDNDDDIAWFLQHYLIALHHQCYQFNDFKHKNIEPASCQCQALDFFFTKKYHPSAEKYLQQYQAMLTGMTLCQNLANTPPNVCNPSYLGQQARELAKQYKNLTCKILTEKQLQQLNMNALLSVGQGSSQESRLICLNYQGGKKTEAPIVFVGKGITFDTGGNSMKTGLTMLDMKFDMCGSATVFGMIAAAAAFDLPLNIIGIISSAENMVDGGATRPSDVVQTMSGLTVEINNTDAEGRLALCDALTYAKRFKPAYVIDIATLTGAVIIALGHHASGLFCEDEELTQALINAGEESGDRTWHLPMWEEYKADLKSNVADILNSTTPKRAAGSITAACFLKHFTEDFRWAHLDIAGIADKVDGKTTASGKPIPMLWQFLLNHCDS